MRCGLVRQVVAGGLQTDFVCVTGALGRLLKVRVTARHSDDETSAMMTVVGHFIGAVTRTVVQASSQGGPAPLNDGPPAQLSSSASQYR